MGATSEQLDALSRDDYSAWPESWGAALTTAAAMTPTPGTLPPTRFADLAAHWSPPQIVEIVAVIALFNYFNRWANALEIPPTR